MSDERPDDGLARMRAGFDQMGSLMTEIAPMLHQFREALREAGFEDEEAMFLVNAYMTRMLWPRG